MRKWFFLILASLFLSILVFPANPIQAESVVTVNTVTLPNSNLRTFVTVQSSGVTATDATLDLTLPDGATYVPGTIQILNGMAYGTRTDAVGDDEAEYSSGARTIRFRLGAGASAIAGGDMSYASVTVSIQMSGSPATPVNAVFQTLQTVIPVVPIVTEAADLYMCATPSPIDQVTTGNPLHYYIDIFDNGPGTASNVTFVADMPANTSFQSLTISAPEYTANVPAVGANGQIRFTVPALSPQYDLKCILSILPTGPSRDITLSASVSADTTDSNLGGNSFTLAVPYIGPKSDLAITLDDGHATVVPGTVDQYTLTVTNNGPNAAENVSVSSTMPTDMAFVAITGTPGLTFTTPPVGSSGTIVVTKSLLGVGASASATIEVRVTSHDQVIMLTAAVTSASEDMDLANNTSTDGDSVVDSPPSIASGHENMTGMAAPAAASGNPAVVPYLADMTGWFMDNYSRPLTIKIVSALDSATTPNNVAGQVQVNGMMLTYAPAAAQGGQTVTILAKANNGYSDSEEPVTVVITVQPQPSSLFQVEFTANGGSPAPSPQTIVDGGKAIEPAAMSRTGYDFTGWFTAGTPETPWNFTARTISGATTLEAGWQKIRYPITYHLGDGSNSLDNPVFYTIGDEAIALREPSRSGYRFDGWFDAATNGSQITSISAQNLTPITLYAYWTPLAAPVPVTGERGSGMPSLLGIALLLGAAVLLIMKRAIRRTA